MPTGSIQFDSSRRPLYVATFQGEQSIEQTQAYLNKLSDVLLLRERFALVADLIDAKAGSKDRWALHAAWMKDNRPAIERYSIGLALVVRSSTMRAALSAVMWMQPIVGPFAIVADSAAANAWLRERFRDAQVPYPSLPPIAAEHQQPLRSNP